MGELFEAEKSSNAEYGRIHYASLTEDSTHPQSANHKFVYLDLLTEALSSFRILGWPMGLSIFRYKTSAFGQRQTTRISKKCWANSKWSRLTGLRDPFFGPMGVVFQGQKNYGKSIPRLVKSVLIGFLLKKQSFQSFARVFFLTFRLFFSHI